MSRVRHILVGTDGWPDQFDAEAWRREEYQVWDETLEMYAKKGEPRQYYKAVLDATGTETL